MERSILAALTLAALVTACATGGGDDAGADDAGEGYEPKLSVLREEVFSPNCSSSSCHGGGNPANGLDLASDGVRDRLVGVASTLGDVDLVVAGDPTASLLYIVVKDGLENRGVRKMPPGVSLSDAKVNLIRDWIEAGANDD